MSSTIAPPPAQSIIDPVVRRFGRFALFGAAYTYLLVVFGGIVRITESGLGCGDDWPKCNGKWIPDFTVPTLIEYVHRLLGVTIGLVLIGLALYAFKHRRHQRFQGANGLGIPTFIVLGLVVVQGLLGAVTVWLELPTLVIVVHFMTALIIMALLLSAALRAGTLGAVSGPVSERARGYVRAAVAAAALGFVVITFGAWTANTVGAPEACQGFPLCNGQLLPASAPQVHIHWAHRLLAFALLAHVLIVALRADSSVPTLLRRAGLFATLAVSAQIAVAAGLVLTHLPDSFKALHLAVGAAVWAALITWALFARRWQRDAAPLA